MKNKYSLNSDNQLLIKSPKIKKPVVTCGRFSIDKNNQLTYWLNQPANWRRIYNLPPRINFAGNWKLNANYDLELILDKTSEQYEGERLILKGEIISLDADRLVFEIKTLSKDGLLHIQILKFTGFWQADEYNQLSFSVKKKALPDTLTLQGAWQINPNQQITYAYEKALLKRKTKISRALEFAGFWQINNANKLTYILAHSTNSKFDFRVQIESPNVYPQEGAIKYRLGIGVKQARFAADKAICLYGVWKFSRKFALCFNMDYGQGQIQAIEFNSEIFLTAKDAVTFSLLNKKNEPLGLCITFSHKFLQKLDAEAFLRLKNSESKTCIEAGVRVPF